MTDAAGPDSGAADAAARAIARARGLIGDAVAALREGGARHETLAELQPERRMLGIPRAARMTRIGRVWRLGVLLLDESGGVFGTGHVVRAERAARKSVTAEAVARQRAWRAAAVKGGIPEGETVDFDAEPVDLDELSSRGAFGPLVLRGDDVLVRWSPTQPDALTPLDAYLRDRVDLLVHPPQGT